MTPSLLPTNLWIWSLQIGLLVAAAAMLPALLRLKMPSARLVYWQLVLVACLLLPVIRAWKQEVVAGAVTVSTAIVAIVPSPASRQFSLPAMDLVLLLLLAAGVLVRVGLLLFGFWRLRRYRHQSCPLEPASPWGAEADLRISDEISSPVTFGFRRPVVLLPARFPGLDEPLRDAILCHEILHVRRHDWLFTVGEEFVRAVLWFHPAIWWLLSEIQLVREQVVDREVVETMRSRDRYIDALLVIAGAPPQIDLATAPLFLRKRHLKQRVVSILKEVQMSRAKSFSALAAGVIMLAASCWFVTGALPLKAAPQEVADTPGVSVEMNGAQLMHRTPVAYPSQAMAKGIQGTVEVQVKLDAAGNVDDASIVSGPEELRKGVLQSVLNWHFAHDSANSTRQVSVAFQLPQGTPQAPTASGAQPTVLKKIMISALSDQQRARLLAQLPVHEGDALDAGKLSNLSHVLGTFDERLAYIIGDDGTLAIRGGGGSWESKDPRLQGPDQPTVVKTITIAGLSDRQRDELLAQLPVHEGDTLDPRAVLALFKTVRTFDEHLSLVLPGDGSVRIAPQPPGPTAPPPPPPPPPPPGAIQSNSQAIRVGREVQQANLVTQVVPVYPLDAKVARVQGTVSFEAAIAKDGTVQNLHLISGPPLLANAALQAVQQWVYRPTLLNGSPIEVITTIDVHFTLSK